MNEVVWKTLIEEQLHHANIYSHTMWETGFKSLGRDRYPKLENVSIPHWRVLPIIGKSSEDDFWYRLSRGIFNVNMNLRTMENLHYLEERDLFHDYFGHLPFLFDKEYTDYLIGLGNFYENSSKTDEIKKALSNLYWYTAEFGLIKEHGETQVLGAGILSSVDELKYAVSEKSNKYLFNIEQVVSIENYVTNGFQNEYFVLPNKKEFKNILKYLWTKFN